MSDEGISAEQQEYLRGFISGVSARRGALGQPDSPIAAGGKLVPEEATKRKGHPLDRWDAIAALATEDKFPRGTDVFLTNYHGLFYVAPAQGSFMCRLRITAGLLSATQLVGVAAIAEELGGGYADITTRANLQIREIPARRGTLFVPMHWTAALCDAGRANPMVGDATDPLSGQPELKHTPAAIAAWTPGWQGFLLSRDIRPDLAQWCAAIPEAGSGCGSCRPELRALLATIRVLEPS